jgi:hypothetical protein
MKNFLLLTCCFVILAGCNSSTHDGSGKLITFDLSNQLNNEKPLMLSEFVSSISYIPLETSKEVLLDDVKFVIPAGEFLIVGAEKNLLKVFNRNGKYENDIGHVGKGPGEYLSIGNVFWDNQTKEVILHARIESKLKFYSIDGSFIRSIPTPYPTWEIFRMNDGVFLGINRFPMLIDSISTQYFLWDLNGMIKPVLPETMKSANPRPIFMINHDHCRIGDMDLLSRPRSDTIYLYNNQNFIPFVSFNLQDHFIPDEVYYNFNLPLAEVGDHILHIVPQPAGEGKFLIYFYGTKKRYTALCDINDRRAFVVEKDKKMKFGITNDVDGGYPFIPTSDFYSQSYYAAISAFSLISQRDKGLYQNADTKFLKLIDGLKPDDNPVVIISKSK